MLVTGQATEMHQAPHSSTSHQSAEHDNMIIRDSMKILTYHVCCHCKAYNLFKITSDEKKKLREKSL